MLRPRCYNLTHLPSPEPPILHGVHARKREITEPSLECWIPVLPINEGRAITLNSNRVRDALYEQATVVIPITKFARDGYSKGTLTVLEAG